MKRLCDVLKRFEGQMAAVSASSFPEEYHITVPAHPHTEGQKKKMILEVGEDYISLSVGKTNCLNIHFSRLLVTCPR